MYDEEGNAKQREIDLADHLDGMDDIQNTIENITKMMNLNQEKEEKIQKMIEESQKLLRDRDANGEGPSAENSKLEKDLTEELAELQRERKEDMAEISQLLQKARKEKGDDQVTQDNVHIMTLEIPYITLIAIIVGASTLVGFCCICIYCCFTRCRGKNHKLRLE